MQTTTQTYNIRITFEDGTIAALQHTMPTRPTTHKGRIAQNNKLEKWAMNNCRNWKEIDIQPVTV